MARSRRGGRGRGYGYGDAGRVGPELRPVRADLNIHTPFSADFHDPDATYLQILQTAEARGLDIIALTDHNSAGGVAAMRREIEDLSLLEELGRLPDDEASILAEYRRLLDRVLVLPGFTLTAAYGFRVLGIFPPETSVRRLEHILLLLGVTEAQMDSGTAQADGTADVLAAYEIIDEHGGLAIPAQVNEAHGVGGSGRYGEATRVAYTQSPLIAALDVTDLDDTSRRGSAALYGGTRPDYPRQMHLIQSSDAHRLTRAGAYRDGNLGIGERATEFALPERSFAALRALFLSDDYSREKPYTAAPPAATDPISAARAEGATITQAFHEQARSRRSRYRPLLKDIVAFANTNGGTLYIGLSANPAAPVVGVPLVDEAVRGLRDSVTRSIIPPLDVEVEVQEVAGKAIIVVRVPKGPDTPYATDAGQVFVRQGAESVIALRDEIVLLVREMPGDRVWSAPRPAYDPEDEEAEGEAAPEPPAPRTLPPARVVTSAPVAPVAIPAVRAARPPGVIAAPADPARPVVPPAVAPVATPPVPIAPPPTVTQTSPARPTFAPPAPIGAFPPSGVASPQPTPAAPIGAAPAPMTAPPPPSASAAPAPSAPTTPPPPSQSASAPVAVPRSTIGAPSPIGGASSPIGVSASTVVPTRPVPAPVSAPPIRALVEVAAPVAAPLPPEPVVSVQPEPEPEPEIAVDEVERETTDDDDDATDMAAEQANRRRPSRRRGGRRRGRSDGGEDETTTEAVDADAPVSVATDESGDALVAVGTPPAPPIRTRTPPTRTPSTSTVEPLPVYSLEPPTPPAPAVPEASAPETATATAPASLVIEATGEEAEPQGANAAPPADDAPSPTTPRRRRRSGGRGRGPAQATEAVSTAEQDTDAPADVVPPVENAAPASVLDEGTTAAAATSLDTIIDGAATGAAGLVSPGLSVPAATAGATLTAETEAASAPTRAGDTNPEAAAITGDAAPPPAGVEILGVTEGDDGVRHYAMRDLKTGRELADVTRRTARGQWRNALIAREDRLPNEERIAWQGARGYGRTVQRDGAAQHDLALRRADGAVRVFYAVPDRELDALWRAVVP